MGRRTRLTKPVVQEQEPRRSFIGKSALILGSLALGGGAWYNTRESPYAPFYHKHLAKARGERFVHEAFIKEIQPTPEEEQERITRLRKGLPPETKILKNTFYQGRAFYRLTTSDQVFADYSQRIKHALNAFIDFAGLEKHMPYVTLEKLTLTTSVQSPTPERIPLYVAHTCLDMKLAGKHIIEWNGKRQEIASVLEEDVGGEMTHELTYTKSIDAITVTSKGTRPVLISAGTNPLKSYNSPLAEVLHVMLWPHTLRQAEADVNRWYATFEGKNAEQITPDITAGIGKRLVENVHREEGVVHAALDLFMKERLQKLGIAHTVFETSVHNQTTDDRYKYIPRMEEAIKQRGCKQVIAEYQTDASALFK